MILAPGRKPGAVFFYLPAAEAETLLAASIKQAMRSKLLLLIVLFHPHLPAAVCNPAQLQGSYAFQLSGDTSIAPERQPATTLGRIVFDGQGGVSGYSSTMFAGYLQGNPVTGTYEAHTDCTISWSLQDDSGAFQHFSGTSLPDEKRIEFRQTDPGAPHHGLLMRSADQCKPGDLRSRYDFTLAGSFTPMLPGDSPRAVDAEAASKPIPTATSNSRCGIIRSRPPTRPSRSIPTAPYTSSWSCRNRINRRRPSLCAAF